MAGNDPHYCPSPQVQQMEHDLMTLATWCASSEDVVVVHDGMTNLCNDYYSRLNNRCKFVTMSELGHLSSVNPITLFPWGRDVHLAHRLSKCGVSCDGMDNEILSNVRRLASRQTAVELLQLIHDKAQDLPLAGSSRFCTGMKDIKESVLGYRKAVLKAPWSSSGRGLVVAEDCLTSSQEGWCRNILAVQGGVAVEPFLNKLQDFACEFYITEEGQVRFEGYSLFDISGRMTYSGNTVASQAYLHRCLTEHYDGGLLDKCVELVAQCLQSRFAGHYTGPVGVDMMLCLNENNKVLLHPCVEINVRYTMGLLSMQLSRLLPMGKVGYFNIHYERNSDNLLQFANQFPATYIDENGLLTRGTLKLTPLTPTSHFLSWLSISE